MNRDDERLKRVLAELKAQFDTFPVRALPDIPELAEPEPARDDVSITTTKECVWIKTPYHEGFKEDIKQLRYPSARWDAAKRMWQVDIRHVSVVLSIIEKWFNVKLKFNPFG